MPNALDKRRGKVEPMLFLAIILGILAYPALTLILEGNHGKATAVYLILLLVFAAGSALASL
jgi:hypothetical protein